MTDPVLTPTQNPKNDPGTGSSPGWPIVVYFHHVHPDLRHYTSLTPDQFRYGLDVLLCYLRPAEPMTVFRADGMFEIPDVPSFLLTFDDGYADTLEYAIPILSDHGLHTVLFVSTDLLGHDSPDPARSYLSWRDCKRLSESGHVIGSHGKSHEALPGRDTGDIHDEVVGSLTELSTHLGTELPLYAYPYGLEAQVPSYIPGYRSSLSAFGTVKAAPHPWTHNRLGIRRVYLPTYDDENWPALVRGWREQWSGT